MNFDFRLTLNTTFYNLPPNTFSYVYVQWAIPYDIHDMGIHSFIIITDIIVYSTKKHEGKSNFQIFPFHFDISIFQVYISQFKLNISQFQLYMYQFQFTFFTSKLTFLSSKVDIYQFELDISLYQVQVTYSSNYCVVEKYIMYSWYCKLVVTNELKFPYQLKQMRVRTLTRFIVILS